MPCESIILVGHLTQEAHSGATEVTKHDDQAARHQPHLTTSPVTNRLQAAPLMLTAAPLMLTSISLRKAVLDFHFKLVHLTLFKRKMRCI